MTRKAHKPTLQNRRTIEIMSAAGIPQPKICGVIGISKPTLHKYYADELAFGPSKANTAVARRLFQYATGKIGTSREQLTAAMFWAKTRMRWHETQQLRHAGASGERLPAPVTGTAPTQIVNIYIPANSRDELPKVIQERMAGKASDNGAGN